MPTPRRRLVAVVAAHLRHRDQREPEHERDEKPAARRRVQRGSRLVEITGPPDRETR